ncbi:MAG TPA: acyl-CoA dehydrogenase family protein [Planctomycetota bacterium]|nr:acyl-CoA dehydrogenase family protein [Planctomycetota bacterium]
MPAPFKTDFLNLESLFTEEEVMARDMVRRWVREEYAPLVEHHYREGTFPLQKALELAELGVFGANIKGYGCAGLSNVGYGLLMQEIEYVDSGLRSFASVQGALVMYPIWAYGSEEQKDYWLPKLAKGEKIGCFGLTEPDFGSDPGGLITKAEDKGDHYVLNGAKMWITNGGLSDVAIVWAKLDGVIRGFLVEKGTPGFSAPLQHRKWSLRASVTSELVLKDVRIPKSNLLPKTDGLKSALGCLSQARYGIAWGALGAAMSCFETARSYTLSRIQFGKPIASFQLIQKKLADMLTEITKGQLLVLHIGRMKDAGKVDFAHISMAKRNNVGVSLEIARTARDMLGANGITDEYSVGRHMMNLETVNTYEGTHDIHALILGERITGIPAYGG